VYGCESKYCRAQEASISNQTGAVDAAAKEDRLHAAVQYVEPYRTRTVPPTRPMDETFPTSDLAQCDNGEGERTNADIPTEDKVSP
jgi:hypothetical protein